MKSVRIAEKKKRKADRKSRKQERKERRLARKHKRQMQKKKRQAKIPSLSSSSDDEQIKGKNQSIKNKLVEKMMEATNMEQQQSIPKKPATTNKREEKNTDVSRNMLDVLLLIKIVSSPLKRNVKITF